MDDKTRTELEAAVFRRLVEHLRTRTDVQNIDLMNLAGFCRNCLSNWMKEAADAKGVPMTQGREPRDRLRHAVRGVEGEAPEGSDRGTEGGIRESSARNTELSACCARLWMTATRALTLTAATPKSRLTRSCVTVRSDRWRRAAAASKEETAAPLRQGSAQGLRRAGRAARGREEDDLRRYPRRLRARPRRSASTSRRCARSCACASRTSTSARNTRRCSRPTARARHAELRRPLPNMCSSDPPRRPRAGGDPYDAARRRGRASDNRNLGGYGSPPARD